MVTSQLLANTLDPLGPSGTGPAYMRHTTHTASRRSDLRSVHVRGFLYPTFYGDEARLPRELPIGSAQEAKPVYGFLIYLIRCLASISAATRLVASAKIHSHLLGDKMMEMRGKNLFLVLRLVCG